MPTQIHTTRVLAALVLAAALTVFGPAAAQGHGGEAATAREPVVKDDPLRLAGAGIYATDRRHRQVRVTVCLEKRSSGDFVAVRCKTKTADAKRLVARVHVPGCVRGLWRTTVSGEAQGAGGGWRHAATATSDTFRCR